MTTPKLVIGIACVVCGVCAQLATTFLLHRIVREVDKALPEDKKIPKFGTSPERQKVMRLHRGYFPESRLRAAFWTSWAAQLVFWGAAIACFVKFVPR